MSVQKNKTPDFEISPDLLALYQHLERLPYKERRLYLKNSVVNGYTHFFYRYVSLDPKEISSIEKPSSTDKLRDVIVNSSLWLSSRESFNDPFDTTAKVIIEGSPKSLRAKLEQLFKTNKPNIGGVRRRELINELMADQEKMLTIVTALINNAFKKCGACCFTVDPRSLLMWSHYANHHKGAVLQFEVVRDTTTFLKAAHVDYVDNYPIINWANKTSEEIKKAFLNKYKNWCYEKEWRIIHFTGGANSSMSFKPEALTGIILGCKIDEGAKQVINQLLVERVQRKLPPVKVYNTYMHDSKYRLIIKQSSSS